jgi:hypothetical protein
MGEFFAHRINKQSTTILLRVIQLCGGPDCAHEGVYAMTPRKKQELSSLFYCLIAS